MVLAEAMAAGVPVVAVDAPGAREVVRDGENGRLLREEDERGFAEALAEIALCPPARAEALEAAVASTAEEFSLEHCTQRLEALYLGLIGAARRRGAHEQSGWERALRQLELEWNLWSGRAGAAIESIIESGSD
jgi:hypothetical protein